MLTEKPLHYKYTFVHPKYIKKDNLTKSLKKLCHWFKQHSKNFYKWGQLVQVRCGCLCQISFSLLATIMLPTKIRPRNTRMFLCPVKCGCWRRVRLLFPSESDFKANFSYIWDLQAQCLTEERSKRNSKNMSYFIVLTFNEYEMETFYGFIQKSGNLCCKRKENIIYFQWKKEGVGFILLLLFWLVGFGLGGVFVSLISFVRFF